MEEDQVEEQVLEQTVSEQPQEEGSQEEQKMVPLAAMLATRKKLQEAEARAHKAEAEKQAYQEFLMKGKQEAEEEPEDDPHALVERKHLQESNAMAKREILETLYQDMNPEAVRQINTYLKPILEKKPWLAATVTNAQNRYARAYEIVQDYMHLVQEKPAQKVSNNEGKKIVENAHKPRSPAEIGKSARPEGIEYLKSIQGKKEFREYREKLLRG